MQQPAAAAAWSAAAAKQQQQHRRSGPAADIPRARTCMSNNYFGIAMRRRPFLHKLVYTYEIKRVSHTDKLSRRKSSAPFAVKYESAYYARRRVSCFAREKLCVRFNIWKRVNYASYLHTNRTEVCIHKKPPNTHTHTHNIRWTHVRYAYTTHMSENYTHCNCTIWKK